MADPAVKKLITGGCTTVSQVSVNKLGGGSGGGIDINPGAFASLIRDKGVPVTWEKAMFCPNRIQDPVPGDHNPNCKLCSAGYIYLDPQETIMVVQGASLQQSFYIQGRFDSGKSTVTALPGDLISYWDRITLKAGVIRYSDMVRRSGKSLTDKLRYRTLEILHLQSNERVFEKGVDFRLDGDNLIWTSNVAGRPADEAYYSILTTRRPVYIIMDLLKQHREVPDNVDGTYSAMPVQAVAMLDFLIRDESRDPNPNPTPASPFSSE